jgi:hypothetical protein
LGKKYYNSKCFGLLAVKNFFTSSKNKISYNFMIFVAAKNGRTKKNIFPPPLLVLLLDPGSGRDKNQDP